MAVGNYQRRAFGALKPLSRELYVHASRALQVARSARVCFMVEAGPGGMPSGLRGFNVARYLRRMGWRATVIPSALSLGARRRVLAWERPDVVVLQQCHHPLHRPELYRPIPCVFDMDDATFLDPAHRDAATECSGTSAANVAGSRYLAQWMRQFNPSTFVVWTGSEFRARQQKWRRSGALAPVVAWAASNSQVAPAEAGLVREVLLAVARTHQIRFWQFGVHHEDSALQWQAPLLAAGIECRILPFLSYRQFLNELRQVTVGLAPLVTSIESFSRGKSFGKVLAYLEAGVPVVASEAVDHGLFFHTGVNGYLATTIEEWSDAIRSLLDSPDHQMSLAERARLDAARCLSTKVQALRIEQILRATVDGSLPQLAQRWEVCPR